jgi:intron-binding protein aquarius
LQDPEFLLDVLVTTYQRRASQRAAINAMPIYPTEGLLWDTTQVRRLCGSVICNCSKV